MGYNELGDDDRFIITQEVRSTEVALIGNIRKGRLRLIKTNGCTLPYDEFKRIVHLAESFYAALSQEQIDEVKRLDIERQQIETDMSQPDWDTWKPSVPSPYRLSLYQRDGGCCRYCGQPIQEYNFHLDHVIPRIQGGRGTRENLAVSCPACNSKKSGRTPEQAGMVLLEVTNG